jgi:hypothetical protein
MINLIWTAPTPSQHNCDDFRVARDVTHAEWAVIEPLLPPQSPWPPEMPVRKIVNAIT